jgi:endonuclease/exonuclease/phosphatase family metal-dependent hydrolase
MKRIPILKGVLLTMNVIAVVVLVMALLASYVPPSDVAVFSITALVYPMILFINLFFIVCWWILRSKYWLLSFLVIILGFNNLQNNFQLSFSRSKAKSESQIKIISYNVQLFATDAKGNDSVEIKNNIVQFLKGEDANIICLQEYHSMDRNVYTPLIDLNNKLLKNSYYYESYFNPRFDQLSGLVIFSKYKAVNKGKLKFAGSRTFGIYTDLIIEDDTVRVFNIHMASIRLQSSDIDFVLKPDFKDQEGFKNRSASIYSKLTDAFLLREQQINLLMQEIIACPYPIILCGDLNDTPSSYVYSMLSDELVDSFIRKGRMLSRTYAGNIPYLRIDYIFTTNHFKINKFERVKKNYSDHFPIISTVSYK